VPIASMATIVTATTAERRRVLLTPLRISPSY
jgi:hypothetical protein